MRRAITLAALVVGALAGPALAQPAAPDGGAIFQQRCAMCHDVGAGHAPSREALGRRSPVNIKMALLTGAMKPQSGGLSMADVDAITTFLTAEVAAKTPPLRPNLCAGPVAPLTVAANSWNGWGRDLANSRFQPHPGLDPADLPRLKLKWAFAYPGALTWGQPTVVGGRVFVADTVDAVYALDAQSGCAVWTVKPGAAVRSDAHPPVRRAPARGRGGRGRDGARTVS